MEKITITINEDIWAKLMQIKAEKKIRTFDEVLTLLLLENEIVKRMEKKK